MHNCCLIAFTLLCTLPALAEEKTTEYDSSQTAEPLLPKLNNTHYFYEKAEKQLATDPQAIEAIELPDLSGKEVLQLAEVLPDFKIQTTENEVIETPIAVAPSTVSEQNPNASLNSLCQSLDHNMNIGVRHIEARGIGYKNGYTTLEGFGIYNRHDRFMPFLDLRGHIFDNGKLAGNAGIGARSFLSSIQHLLGYYLYYDIRQVGHDLTAQQLSPGIELLGRRMEYRINAYFPVGNQKSDRYNYDFDAFKGNNILLRYKRQYVMKGADAEIGVHIAQSRSYDFYAGIGPYYFQASHDQSWGGKARLKGKYKEYVTLEASYSYDHLFGSIVQGSIGITLPFGTKVRKKERSCPQGVDYLLNRESQSPYRFEIPVIKKHRSVTKAINPSTNEPWVVWFVDNTSSSLGTFNSPFPTLAEAQSASAPNEIIYVFPGDGTTTGLNAGITLQNNQKLFGSGISQSIPTTQGTITIPQFSTTAPVITNASGSVIFLANNNEISGLNLTTNLGTTPTLIIGSNISSGNIHDNNLFASVPHGGIQITGTGFYNIQKNHFVAPPSFLGNAISFNGGLSAMIKNNVVEGYEDSVSLDPSNMDGLGAAFTLIGNTLSKAGQTAILFEPPGPSSETILILDSNILDSNNNAIHIQTGNPLCLTVNNNLIHNSTYQSLLIEIDEYSTAAFITNNTVSGVGAGSYGIQCSSFHPLTSFCVVLNNNVVNGGNGFLLKTTGNGNMTVSARGNEGTLTTMQIGGGTITLDSPNSCSCSQ
jgi:hypothetical protein